MSIEIIILFFIFGVVSFCLGFAAAKRMYKIGYSPEQVPSLIENYMRAIAIHHNNNPEKIFLEVCMLLVSTIAALNKGNFSESFNIKRDLCKYSTYLNGLFKTCTISIKATKEVN